MKDQLGHGYAEFRDWIRGIDLRSRIAALTAGAVAVAVLVVSVGAFVLVRRELRMQVDQGLVRRVAIARTGDFDAAFAPQSPNLANPFGLDNSIQVITDGGQILLAASPSQRLPVTQRDLRVARGAEAAYLQDETIESVHLRVLTAQVGTNHAIQMARALTEVDGTLRNFTLLLLILAGVGIAGAAGAGMLVARRAITPVERLTGAAEHVARTQELSARIVDDNRADELGRLARSFNDMLAALEVSREQQRRLIADASHELRTPLTSLRTNIEVLSRFPNMAPAEREQLMDDLHLELNELTDLVGELVGLATEQRGAEDEEITDVALDEITAVAVDRTQRRTGRSIVLTSQPSPLRGRPQALERAISNLLDNATKWGPPDEQIDVRVEDGTVEVRDRGPGISSEDRPRVFDRFYRAADARSMPGSGLGLSIVKQVVDVHGGRVWAGDAPGGGAVVGFEIPAEQPEPHAEQAQARGEEAPAPGEEAPAGDAEALTSDDGMVTEGHTPVIEPSSPS